MHPTRFVPSPDSYPSEPRIDDASDIRDILAIVAMPQIELIIGLDLGRVIRVVPMREQDGLTDRAKRQLAFHGARAKPIVHTEQLYLLDVQAVERLPDEPGANDPLYLYGALRGPYPEAITAGVAAVEGQFSTTRGALLHGLALGTAGAFVTEGGASGARCVHAVVPGGTLEQPSVVLAFPLVPMGEDATNELVAAQLFHDVLGALRHDLGDDLGADPVPVPDRKRHERELADAGWKIEGEHAVKKTGGKIASLFSPAKKQKLPAQAKLDDYPAMANAHVSRIEGWPTTDVLLLRQHLLLDRAQPRPAAAKAPPAQPAPKRAPTQPPAPPVSAAPSRPGKKHRDTMPSQWIKVQVDQHRAPDRPAPRVTTPGRVHDAEAVMSWMFELITGGDDDKK